MYICICVYMYMCIYAQGWRQTREINFFDGIIFFLVTLCLASNERDIHVYREIFILIYVGTDAGRMVRSVNICIYKVICMYIAHVWYACISLYIRVYLSRLTPNRVSQGRK